MAAVALSVRADDDLDTVDEEMEEVAQVVDDDDSDSPDNDAPVVPPPPFTPAPHITPSDAPSLPSWVETYINETRELESRASRLMSIVETVKENLKSAKQQYEDAVNELRQLVRCGPDRQQRLPFPEDEAPVSPMTVNTTVIDDESWKAVPIVELDLAEPIKQKLLDHGISTVGELADYTAQGNLLTDIKGVGAAKAEKIEAALERFWESRN